MSHQVSLGTHQFQGRRFCCFQESIRSCVALAGFDLFGTLLRGRRRVGVLTTVGNGKKKTYLDILFFQKSQRFPVLWSSFWTSCCSSSNSSKAAEITPWHFVDLFCLETHGEWWVFHMKDHCWKKYVVSIYFLSGWVWFEFWLTEML